MRFLASLIDRFSANKQYQTLVFYLYYSFYIVKYNSVVKMDMKMYLKVGTNENGLACGRWLSIGI